MAAASDAGEPQRSPPGVEYERHHALLPRVERGIFHYITYEFAAFEAEHVHAVARLRMPYCPAGGIFMQPARGIAVSAHQLLRLIGCKGYALQLNERR